MNKLNRSQKISADRLEERVESRLPIKLAKAQGLTYNISASGVYFELAKSQKEGSKIKFEIELNTPGGPFNLACSAQVVRVQKINGKYGIAAKIINQELLSNSANAH